MNELHKERFAKLKEREERILRILKQKTMDLDKQAFDQRQKILKEFDTMTAQRKVSDQKV